MNSKVASRIFDGIIYIVIIFAVLACLLPFLHVAALSLSSNDAVITQKVTIFPVDFNLEAYSRVLTDSAMLRSLWVTIEITVLFTLIGMFLTICCAYPLTKTRLKGRKVLSLIVLFTMYFSGGIIPEYLLMNKLHLLNTKWSLILPLCFSPYNMIIMKTFFSSNIPDSIEESAKLDGCSDIGILIKMVLPLSLPILATLSLFYAVGRWNAFQDALFYITKQNLYPLQLKLNQLVSASASTDANIGQEAGGSSVQLVPEVLKAACIMFATIPILLVYPWLQKYFVSGVMVGAVKG